MGKAGAVSVWLARFTKRRLVPLTQGQAERNQFSDRSIALFQIDGHGRKGTRHYRRGECNIANQVARTGCATHRNSRDEPDHNSGAGSCRRGRGKFRKHPDRRWRRACGWSHGSDSRRRNLVWGRRLRRRKIGAAGLARHAGRVSFRMAVAITSRPCRGRVDLAGAATISRPGARTPAGPHPRQWPSRPRGGV